MKYRQLRVWFERWIIEGYTVRQLAQQSGHSASTLRRVIRYWLHRPTQLTPIASSALYLIFDGTFFDRHRGVFAVMNAERFCIVHGEPTISEGPAEMQRICANLRQRGITPKTATVDGNPHLIRALRRHWPSIIIQRCLVHVQRQGLSWCRRFPKRTDAKHLRLLFLRVMAIHTLDERDAFLADVRTWEERFGDRIGESRETGWVFSDLKRARSMLLAALPNMFHYLDDPNIQRSTNPLEGYFARLKQRYRQHRGLSP
ncbi:MAG: transposase, partial [Ignavibacteriae bacterium]|nr:transposase [Ignavibacteriota bacterium]